MSSDLDIRGKKLPKKNWPKLSFFAILPKNCSLEECHMRKNNSMILIFTKLVFTLGAPSLNISKFLNNICKS